MSKIPGPYLVMKTLGTDRAPLWNSVIQFVVSRENDSGKNIEWKYVDLRGVET